MKANDKVWYRHRPALYGCRPHFEIMDLPVRLRSSPCLKWCPHPQETSVPRSKKTLSNDLIPVISAGNHLLTSYPVRELRATVHNEHSDFKIPLVTLLKFRELRKNTERRPRLARQSSPTDSTSLCAPAVWPSAPVLDKKLKDDFRK